jgi:hypothetical protein
MHPIRLEPTTSPSTLLLQRKEVSFELELIGTNMLYFSRPYHIILIDNVKMYGMTLINYPYCFNNRYFSNVMLGSKQP